MKARIKTLEGEDVGEIEVPSFFNERVREDLIARAFLSLQVSHRKQYGAYILAGKQVSASGKERHRRRKYKTLYGYGISRVPRKILSRRGDRFYWIGAFAPGTVGGRRAHPPIPFKRLKKVNKKEIRKALKSAFAATASKEFLQKKYEKYKISDKIELPFVIEKIELKEKRKEIFKSISNMLEKNLGDFAKRLITPEKKIRSGKGKTRGRKYKKKVGMLLIVSSEEKKKVDLNNFGVETIEAKKVGINNLAPGGIPGRFTIYTDKAIEELKNRFIKNVKK